jgi:hypothetical protein
MPHCRKCHNPEYACECDGSDFEPSPLSFMLGEQSYQIPDWLAEMHGIDPAKCPRKKEE